MNVITILLIIICIFFVLLPLSIGLIMRGSGKKDKCLEGPSYWCDNDDNFKKCVVNKDPNYKPGTHICDYPICKNTNVDCIKAQCANIDFKCATDTQYKLCNPTSTVSRCQDGECTNNIGCNKAPIDKCLDGPVYWCANDSNYKDCVSSKDDSQPKGKCDNDSVCQKNGLCENKCTYGPSEWCDNDANYKDCVSSKDDSQPKNICDKDSVCQNSPYCNLLGENKCTYGPSEWCDNDANYKDCVSSKDDSQPKNICDKDSVCQNSQFCKK
jgi:hypothetical protein